MTSYTYRKKASELIRLDNRAESSTYAVRSASESRKTFVHASEVDAPISTRPTLDDFGGRSDALGG
jgi:hypothetical protein